jgi:uncharacterized protein
MSVALWALAVLLVIVGIVGTILPALPGAPLVFGGLLLAAYADGFHRVGAFTLIVLGVLTVVAVAADYAATALGAKRAGASAKAIVGAAIGTLIGVFFALPGLIFGPFIGAVIGEYIARRDLEQAGRAGLGTWIGLVIGTAIKIAVVFTMLGTFAAAYFWSASAV